MTGLVVSGGGDPEKRSDGDVDIVTRCSARAGFDLTYARAEKPREFHEDGITGDMIDDAYSDGKSPADWSNGGKLIRFSQEDPGWTEDHVFATFFDSAVTEAVHEALEWFRIDGKPALDPHDRNVEMDIYALSEQFAADLWALRAKLSQFSPSLRSGVSL